MELMSSGPKKVMVTGSGGLIGSECARLLAREGWNVVGVDNDMRQQFFGPAGTTRAVVRDLVASRARLPPLRPRHPRPPGRARSAGRRAAGLHHSHGRAALARQGRVHSVRRFRRQRGGHDEHAGGRARLLQGFAVLLHQHQQGVRRPARTTCRCRNSRSAGITPTGWTASTRTCRSTTACTRSSAPPRWPPT